MKLDQAKTRENTDGALGRTALSKRVSVLNDTQRSEITYLSIEKLLPYRNQARTIFNEEELNALASTIKEHGIRQPLTVLRVATEEDDVAFEVVSGERRLRAAKIASLSKVPCIIIDDHQKAEEIALIENIQRQDLHPVELARSLKLLTEHRGWGSQSELKEKIGLPASSISELLKLNELSSEIQEMILSKNIRGREIYRKLFDLKNDEQRVQFLMGVSKETSEGSPSRKLTMQSILRIGLDSSGIKVQKTKLAKLSQEDRVLVKNALSEILDELK